MAARVHVPNTDDVDADTDDDAGHGEEIGVLAKTHSGRCEDIAILAKTHSGASADTSCGSDDDDAGSPVRFHFPIPAFPVPKGSGFRVPVGFTAFLLEQKGRRA